MQIHASRLIALTQSTSITACVNSPIDAMCRTFREITPQRSLVRTSTVQANNRGQSNLKQFGFKPRLPSHFLFCFSSRLQIGILEQIFQMRLFIALGLIMMVAGTDVASISRDNIYDNNLISLHHCISHHALCNTYCTTDVLKYVWRWLWNPSGSLTAATESVRQE